MLNTKLIRVFVSCPGDVSSEKEIIKKVCESLNHGLSKNNRGIIFEVLDFKDIVAAWGDRPQQDINTRFSGYDIYIGLLWMRYGTPSGDSDPITGKPYESGTEEEFRIAKAKFEEKLPIEIYFLFKDPRASSNLAETKQLLKVQEFKEEIQTNGWVSNFPNTLDTTDFNNKIHGILNDWIYKIEHEEMSEQKTAFTAEIKSKEKTDKPIVLLNFFKSAPAHQNIIKRTLIAFDPEADPMKIFYSEASRETLSSLVEKQSRIVLLGNAGAGKSTELANMVHHFSDGKSTLIPVFKRMNTYVDENIEDFLPADWDQIPENIALVVLDGLDEVQPIHFNTLVRKISTFSDKFPKLKMVVSCRTNFYEFPSNNSSGTLSDFNVYLINEIELQNIPSYAKDEFSVDGEAFVFEAYNEGYRDLIQQPFFLKMLLEKYVQQGNLNIRKVELLNEFVERRFDFDQNHFKSTTPLKEKKPYIIGLLKKVALTLEYMGKNYLSYEQLQEIFRNPDDLELIKFSTAFRNFESDPTKWGFEHNNIQEFLAASALLEMDIAQIKGLISLNGIRIKPSWVNTLFFLMSILDDQKRTALINWILLMEPEILVKIEPDKINAETRFAIFKNIFNHYKTQGVWLRSNKFSNRELARFAMPEDTNAFLVEELSNPKNTRHNRLNALDLLKNQQLGENETRNSKKAILNFIFENSEDGHAFNAGAYALVMMGLADDEVIGRLMETFGSRNNQYIRSGMYKLINKVKLHSKYIEYLIQGIGISDNDQDREKVNLMDESMQLDESLSAPLDIDALKKLIAFFADVENRRLYRYHERHEIIRSIVTRASALYSQHPELYELLFNLFIKYAKGQENISGIISDFFVKTGTRLVVFKEIFASTEIGAYQKSILYRQLLDKTTVDYVIEEFLGHNITNKNLLQFYEEVKWMGNKAIGDELHYLEEQINAHSDLLNNKTKENLEDFRKLYEQKNVDLYFSIEDFRNEILLFFKKNNLTELAWDELFSYKRYDIRDENEIRDPVFDFLVDLSRNSQFISLERVIAFMDQTEKFQDYLFAKFKDKLTSNPKIVPNPAQQNHLEAWVKDRSLKANIKESIKVNQLDRDRINYDPKVQTLWYFIEKFDIEIGKDKILDFTTYDDFRRNTSENFDFETIEKQVGKEQVEKRIIGNLKTGIEYDTSWKNNALYAINHKLVSSYSYILKELHNNQRSEYYRKEVLELYAKEANDLRGLYAVLDAVGKNNLRWTLVRLILEKEPESQEILNFLHGVLKNNDEIDTEKFLSSQQLTNLKDRFGTEYYLDYLINNNGDMTLDYYYDAAFLRSILDPYYVPKLMELLKIAKTDKAHDDFNRLEPLVTETLMNIALTNEDNLLTVKSALLEFIEKNTGKIEYVNFLYPFIDRIEYQFYLSASQTDDIKHALREVEKILKE
ncbi:NACHT domain-containing protein [Pedobacter sp. R-06]|uniref:NACHT domain-containing protein n=1 Tax=Pedobacter sp. R-06 TaxID=3404051 RepID=UPI003CF05C77